MTKLKGRALRKKSYLARSGVYVPWYSMLKTGFNFRLLGVGALNSWYSYYPDKRFPISKRVQEQQGTTRRQDFDKALLQCFVALFWF